jgi:hypothetical protein
MTVPIQIPWDLFHGKIVVWCECLRAGVRRAVLLPRLDTIFAPRTEDPQRELPYEALDWRLVSPTEAEWERYARLVEKEADRAGLSWHRQRVENLARWVDGRQVAVPQYHLWLCREPAVLDEIAALYATVESGPRREAWRRLLEWTAPAATRNPTEV